MLSWINVTVDTETLFKDFPLRERPNTNGKNVCAMKIKTNKKRGRPRKLKTIIKQDLSGDRSYLVNNFIDLNPNYISDHPEVKSLVKNVFQEMVDQGYGYNQKTFPQTA